MKSKILKALKDNIIYVVLAALVASAAAVGIIVSYDRTEKIIIHSDSKPVYEESSESAEETERVTVITADKEKRESTRISDEEIAESVPEISEAASENAEDVVFPLDINLATAEQLMKIKGVGEVTAAKIIDYRSSVGVIYNMDLLLEVSGIGENTLDLLKEYLYVSEYDYREIAAAADVTAATEVVGDIPENEESKDIVETAATAAPEPEPEPVMQKVNVNTADAEEISQKLLIDMELAENIVELRSQIHGFSNMLELLYAEGMTEGLLSRLQYYIEI